MTPTEAAEISLQDHVAIWSVGEVTGSDVVDVACDALVAGLDTPGLRVLAACTQAEASYDVHDLLPAALHELGLVFYPFDSAAGREAAVPAFARRVLAGEFTPSEFAARVHRCYGREPLLTRRLAELDYEYEILQFGDRTMEEIDAEVIAEAQNLAAGARPREA
ncbi:hypothetical protein [Streptomyces sp. NPDC059957]|uniref:hypothetical protein n=1 Tax=unclassified Streptomyces TaxID=2593676 RepID=UPI00364ABAB3